MSNFNFKRKRKLNYIRPTFFNLWSSTDVIARAAGVPSKKLSQIELYINDVNFINEFGMSSRVSCYNLVKK